MASGGQPSILLVEADRDYADQIAGALSGQRYGYVVRHVPDMAAALERLDCETFDAIVLNPDLPDSDPLDAVSRIRSECPDLPIVVATDVDDELVLTRAMRQGAQDILPKQHTDHHGIARAIRYALERKYAGQALRESEERFRRVFEEGPIGMALVGKGAEFIKVNAALCRMLGRGQTDLTGMTVRELAHDEDVVGVEQVERVCRGEISYCQSESRFLRKNGSVVWGLLTASVVRGQDGGPLYGIAMVEDITERRRAEEAVRESHSLLHAVIGGTPDAIYIKDLKGRYLLLNQAAAQLLGRPASEIIGRTDEELLPETLVDLIRESDREVIESGEPRTFEERFRDGDVERTYLSTKGVYRDESDEAIGLFGIARDITDRKRAEDELRRSEAKYRALVDHAVYGIYRSTPEGRFVSVNPALVSMLKYESEAQLLAINMDRDLYADPTERQRLVAQYVGKDLIDGLEVEWKRRDGKHILVRLSGRTVRDDRKQLEGFEMIVEDVTERRTLETQLRQAQKMEAVGELTGGIAHDLNNLLTIVSANLDLAIDSLPPEGAALRSDLEETLGAARRGRVLIEKLLGFSRRSKLEVKPVNPGQLAADLLSMLQRILPENIRLNLVVDEAAAVIKADPSAVEQVLINLITNSRDAMPEGGQISIRVSRSRLDEPYRATHPWAKLDSYARITVSDEGEGMDPQVKERIFEPFFTTKPHGVGTGLGMAMVYGLMKQLDGAVEVESEPGVGTAVHLYFPLCEVELARPVREEAVRLPQGGSETILLVEDEEPIRRATRRVLERHGYQVLTAGDGEEALDTFRREGGHIDLVVSDVVMPRLSGAKLHAALRRLGAPRVLFTSGYTARDVRDKGVLDPSVPFLHKPWTVTELLQKVREVLDAPVA